MAGETILVTGGAGYIGSHVVLALRDRGLTVVVVDDFSTGREGLVPSDVPVVRGNAGDRTLIADLVRAHGVGVVLHFAASAVVPESVSDPLGYYRNNTSVSRNLLEVCIAGGVSRFVFSSTAAVYGELETAPVAEDAEPRPINPYGRSKLMTEWMLADVATAHGMRYAALRYFNVAGADPQGRSGECIPEATHLLKIASEVAIGRRSHVEIYGEDYDTPDGTCIRDYVHVTDLADAHLAALDHIGGGGDNITVNCGYGHGYSVREMLRAVEAEIDSRLDVRSGPRRPGDPPVLVADATRLRALGWRPLHDDLKAIVKSAINWERRLSELNPGGSHADAPTAEMS